MVGRGRGTPGDKTMLALMNFPGISFREIALTVGTKIIVDPGTCFQEFISENYKYYCGMGPIWNQLSFPVIFRLCSLCRTKSWNQSESN